MCKNLLRFYTCTCILVSVQWILSIQVWSSVHIGLFVTTQSPPRQDVVVAICYLKLGRHVNRLSLCIPRWPHDRAWQRCRCRQVDICQGRRVRLRSPHLSCVTEGQWLQSCMRYKCNTKCDFDFQYQTPEHVRRQGPCDLVTIYTLHIWCTWLLLRFSKGWNGRPMPLFRHS